MKFTIEKTKLIEKLQSARKGEVESLKQQHEKEVADFKKRLKETKAALQAAIKEIDNGVLPYIEGRYTREVSEPKPKETNIKIQEIDAAISVLNIVADQQITLDDRADKWNLIGLLKAALG